MAQVHTWRPSWHCLSQFETRRFRQGRNADRGYSRSSELLGQFCLDWRRDWNRSRPDRYLDTGGRDWG